MRLFSVILGVFVACVPLLADKSNEIQSIKNDISKAHKNSVAKILSQNIELTDKPKNHKNWGEWIIAENAMDSSKWRAVKMKGTDMWGISPIVDGKNDCGAVLWICQHSKKMTFDASKFSENGSCAKIRESYKEADGSYKKVVAPFVFQIRANRVI